MDQVGKKKSRGASQASLPAKQGEQGAGCNSRAGASRNLASRHQDAQQKACVSAGVRGRGQGQSWDPGGMRLGRDMRCGARSRAQLQSISPGKGGAGL